MCLQYPARKLMKRTRVYYKSHAIYDGRRIITRDRAWIEFVPKGQPAPEGYLLRVTQLAADDDHVREQAPNNIDLNNFDVYGVYETTSG